MLTSFAKQVNSAKTKVFHKPALAIDQTNRAKVTPVAESILQCRKAEINKSTSNVLIAPQCLLFSGKSTYKQLILCLYEADE